MNLYKKYLHDLYRDRRKDRLLARAMEVGMSNKHYCQTLAKYKVKNIFDIPTKKLSGVISEMKRRNRK